ncbi:hypothetical protein NFI96_014872 [Prochilodus magdalenae]|nr:hypothetical protein NFI96_014872 [Prochilodus magdalenae]
MSAKIPHPGSSATPRELERSSEQKPNRAPLYSSTRTTAVETDREQRDEAAPVAGLCLVSPPAGVVQQAAPNPQLAKWSCQHLAAHRSPQEQEQLLQLQLQQMQKVLQEQNALLSFLSPGLMPSSTFLTQHHSNAPVQYPEMDAVIHADSLLSSRMESSNTVLNGTRSESEEPVHGTQSTHQSDCIPPKPVGAEQRCLSPVEEECSDSVKEQFPISPFGVRRKLPADPEERPIRPGLNEKEKTFEDLVEEQIKVDTEALRPVKQAELKSASQYMYSKHSYEQFTASVSMTEKRNFLRKGDGRSRIGKNRDAIQKIQYVSCNQQAKDMNSALLQQEIRMSNNDTKQRRCPALQDSLIKTKDEEKHFSDQRPPVDRHLNNVGPRYHIKQPGDLNPSSDRMQSPSLRHALTHDQSSSSQKSEDSKEPKRSSESHNQRLSQGYTKHSGGKGDLTVRPLERVSFKKINDRIVRVNEGRGHSPDIQDGHTVSAEPSIERLSLTTEVMQLLLDSNSSGSTSAEDEFESHKLPVPSNTSMKNHNNQNLELSEEDYASDAPSEPRNCPVDKVRPPHCFSVHFPSSSDSDEEASDSELQCLSWSEAEKVRNTAESSAPADCKRQTGRNSNSRLPCNPNLLTKIFPQIKSTRRDKTEDRTFNTQQSTDGKEPPKNVQVFSYFMMDKMKTEQDKALTFIRAEMDQFVNNDKGMPRSSYHTPEEGIRDIHEAQGLRQQIQSLKVQLNQRECEWWQIHSKLQSRVDALIRENQQLQSNSALSERNSPNHSTGRSTPRPRALSMSAEGSEVAGSVPYRRSSTPALSLRREATTAGKTVSTPRPYFL